MLLAKFQASERLFLKIGWTAPEERHLKLSFQYICTQAGAQVPSYLEEAGKDGAQLLRANRS